MARPCPSQSSIDLTAGREAFADQMDHLADRCRSNRPIRADQPVHLPGDQAARGVAQTRQHGIQILNDTWQGLSAWAERLHVALPA